MNEIECKDQSRPLFLKRRALVVDSVAVPPSLHHPKSEREKFESFGIAIVC